MKPRIFVGSSTEGLSAAYALQNNLDRDAEVTVWTQDVFRPSKFTLDSLTDQLDNADVGIFVFSADDVVKMRGTEYATVRDNVIFEYGLYVGRLGRERSFIVAPTGEPLHLPTDLLGMNYLTYQPDRTDKNLEAALGPASNKIRTLLSFVELRVETLPPELNLSFSERTVNLSYKQRKLLATIVQFKPISMNELLKRFSQMQPPEMSYRLEHLRLQMFISVEPSEDSNNSRNHTYRPTRAYEKYLSDKPLVTV